MTTDLLFGASYSGASIAAANRPKYLGMSDMRAYASGVGVAAPAQYTDWTGDKFEDGFGITELECADYWTLRARSGQLFNSNLYARGLIRRLITNEINTGLNLEATPEELALGVEQDSLQDWSEKVEALFTLWGKSKDVCDFEGLHTFGAIQRAARREALVAGDVLVVLRNSPKYGTTNVQLISGQLVQTPSLSENMVLAEGHEVVDGVELDAKGRQVAYWITQEDGSSRRQLAKGPRSGRQLAWLLYGTDRRHNAVRGQPLLAIILQSLKEIDRYRDAAQRKAVINSMLAMFITKTEDKIGSRPISGGARRATTQTVDDGGSISPRQYNNAWNNPGIVFEELQQGEEPKGFDSTGTDINFPTFEAAIIRAVAWANEMPPEILELSFSNNYSASQAAINEFKIYLNLVRTQFGEDFCQPIYGDWFLSSTITNMIQAPGFLEAVRTPRDYTVRAAWLGSDWSGQIKPSTDIKKQAQGYELLLDRGLITYDRAARELTGMKFSKVIKRIRRENEMLVDARRPIAEFDQEFNTPTNQPNGIEAQAQGILDRLDEIEESLHG